MTLPLVSVITSTWQRHEPLLHRCIPSVQQQDYPHVQHLVVSDGPDDKLAARLDGTGVLFAALPVHDPSRHWGGPARRYGISLAGGDLVAYLDDDDTWRPWHVSTLVAALEAPTPASGTRSGGGVLRPAVMAPS